MGGTSLHTPLRSVTCYHCGRTGHVRTQCPQLSKPSGGVGNRARSSTRYSAQRVAAVNSANDGQTAKPHDKASSKGSTVINTETESNATGEVNRIAVMNNNDVIDTDFDDVIVKPVDVCSLNTDTNDDNIFVCSASVAQCDGDMVVSTLVDSG